MIMAYLDLDFALCESLEGLDPFPLIKFLKTGRMQCNVYMVCFVRMHGWMHAWIYEGMHVRMRGCMAVWMYEH